ncbi:YheC/YheD family protein [Brucella gallinifaecis]|uniref:YheC/YheD family protein n=1 Tax=Brucella gallinifaecis TaxID=215590 RepID=UPI00235E3626|nr:YheC/YheD family protein [Brucella gallinifaecis]
MLNTCSKIDEKLSRIKALIHSKLQELPYPALGMTLFFSVCDGDSRANVTGVRGNTFDDAWEKGVSAVSEMMAANHLYGRWLRVDWVEKVEPATWQALRQALSRIKRNYFRYGIALDEGLQFAFTEQEVNANAMFYGGNSIAHAQLNENNFSFYARKKYPELISLSFKEEDKIFVLSTKGIFCDEEGTLYELNSTGQDTGRRHLKNLEPDNVLSLIENSSDYLARQVNADGSFVYGYHPCFDRRINTYNTLRHASTTYSMIEAWEVTRNDDLMAAITRSLDYLTGTLIREVSLSSGQRAAFLVDTGDEIKLGANAVAILALTKYSAVTGSQVYLPMAEKLAHGIRFMQNAEDGSFSHVLNYPDLSVKERFRTIYYEGEAAFGLMRLYEITKDPILIETVEKAFEHFIANDHWQHHDHWLSYCVNELTRYRPDERYYRFGIQNFATYLDFVLERITTFPTLLELMMAAEAMITRIREQAEYRYLLDGLDLMKFYRALHVRAHYLLNGHFWPEIAMYYRNPERIVGSFFIRHHAFRVRIDDVEHYLSGFIAYRKFLLRGGTPDWAHETTQQRLKAARSVDPISLGFLMYPESPKGFTEIKMLAEKSALQGLRVFYMSYKTAKITDGKINGFAFANGRWEKAEFDIPAIIDNAPPRKSPEAFLFNNLAETSFLTCHKLGGKRTTLAFLQGDPVTRQWLIPSQTLNAENIEQALNTDGKVIIKPYRSNRGRGVYLLQRDDNGSVSIRTNQSVTKLDSNAFQSFVASRANSRWMLQKYIASVDEKGRAFDIRVPVFRADGGQWRTARIYSRLGSGDITSNLATGGSSHDALAFLCAIYGAEIAKQLVEQLEGAARQIAESLQRHYPFIIDALGCDFGIVDGQAYLFEVNSYPGIKGCLESAVEHKANFYKTISRSLSKEGDGGAVNSLNTLSLFEPELPLPREQPAKKALRPVAVEAETTANQTLLRKVMAGGENDFSRSPFLRSGMGNPAYALIRKEARRRGYKSKIVNNTHLEVFNDEGVVAVFSPNSPDLCCAPREVASSKKLTKVILREAGLPTPVGSTFSNYDAALKYLMQRDRPQVVKPVRGYGGIGVTTNVTTEDQFQKAWQRASRGKKRVVVEDFFTGDEIRLIVLGGETVAAVCRMPAYVVGDGINSVAKLVEIKNEQRKSNPLMRLYPVRQFDYLEHELGLGLDFVPGNGQFIRLSTVSNVGLGGEAVSLVDVLHPSFLDLARKAFDALPGATQLGLDVIAKNFGADAFEDNAAIIEVNSDPAIGTPCFAAYGPPASQIAVKLLDYIEERKACREDRVPAEAVIQPARLLKESDDDGARANLSRLQTQLLRNAAERAGCHVKPLSSDTTVVSRDEKRCLFWLGMSDKTSMAARRASRDIAWSRRLLQQAGLAIPEHKTFATHDIEQGWRFASETVAAVSVRGTASSRSSIADHYIISRTHFEIAWHTVVESGAQGISVERLYAGKIFRFFVIENRVVAVTLRSEVCELGDQITGETQAPFVGETRSIDVTGLVHSSWANIAVRARKAIFNPFHAGVDVFAEDITIPPEHQKWFVSGIKVNPDFSVHHFPSEGEGRDVTGSLLEGVFK